MIKNKELLDKSNNELAILVLNLKLKLLECNFAAANGSLEKPHSIKEIKRLIALILTMLNQRGFDVSISTHGIDLIDKNTHKITSLTKDANTSFKDIKTSSAKTVKKDIDNNSLSDIITETKDEVKKTPIIKEKQVQTDNKVIIRRGAGG